MINKVFVSGCYDILHAGHIQFFKDARNLGDHLTVCFASKEVLFLAKKREPAIPDDHKRIIIGSLNCVDKVVSSSDVHPFLDFVSHLKKEKPQILAVTGDDKNIEIKRKLCDDLKIKLVILPKTVSVEQISTTDIRANIMEVKELPLRVDFAGGWLDVPKYSIKGGYIVNCTITPKVSLKNWQYNIGGGLGGSAAYRLLETKNGVETELDLGVGWQDPVVIMETGLCVWRSGKKAVLEYKINPDWLKGKMLIRWTGTSHTTFNNVDRKRDYNLIKKAGIKAAMAVKEKDLKVLCQAINMSYEVQLKEGMEPLSEIAGSIAKKYLGGGYGGYALYVFSDEKKRNLASKKDKEIIKIEPYIDTY
jgi:cytidyltransferase-like protein